MLQITENWRLINDSSCYVLQRRRVVASGTNKGSEYWQTICYPSTLKGGLKSAMDHMTKEELEHSEYSLPDALNRIDMMAAQIAEAAKI